MSSVIGLISTNYTGEHYGKLIEDRPVASIPFGGRYRLIDFTLSSMANSDIGTVGVITPSNYRSLADHLNGASAKSRAVCLCCPARCMGSRISMRGSVCGM